jgi:hypothetical protein
MNGFIDAERILDAYLAPEADRLPDRVIDAALADIARTPQRRALRVPWRFLTMPALSRATGIAAVALVAVVGAGSVMYLSSNTGNGSGSQKTAAPTLGPTAAPTAVPTAEPTSGPSFVAPGITGWKTYTSAVYGYTISYPEHWVVGDRATQTWQPGEPEDSPSSDLFFNDDDDMAFLALQFPAPTGADLSSWEGLLAALTEMCAKPAEFVWGTCPSDTQVTRLCLGTDCQPVALAKEDGFPRAIFGDPDTGIFTYIQLGRRDDFPAAAKYGGTEMLLKSILGELGVREPRPEETPN